MSPEGTSQLQRPPPQPERLLFAGQHIQALPERRQRRTHARLELRAPRLHLPELAFQLRQVARQRDWRWLCGRRAGRSRDRIRRLNRVPRFAILLSMALSRLCRHLIGSPATRCRHIRRLRRQPYTKSS